MQNVDLPSYFRRIGFTGTASPTIETLSALHLAHISSIPFENLAAWTGRRVHLDLESIEAKLVAGRRGGYCFEHNALFAAVLRQIGFEVTELISRVTWNQPPSGFTHMLLLVELDGDRWIADVGFGAVGQTVPLLLEPDLIQSTPHETRRYRLDQNVYTQQMLIGPNRWEDLYHFELKPVLPIDYEVGNWYTNSHPESLFRKTLLTTLPCADHWRVIAFGEYTLRYLDGRVQTRPIESDEDLRDLLVRDFGMPENDRSVLQASLFPAEMMTPVG
ncbi:arylamine N-acetyltransferase [Luteolibacter pohnpeiensis]|uniref:Arylamine N-acetyltransferase n=1 Tax=Luteolibacter pohnpeiensis TaxID=454153 RepID=A0A934SAC0_9BACT|nr:arylamine N-acetyltransferase [Luteolibacter pohnpeiensis]MBK1882552.1 arylamine N-acetyltransferase [Luteolibacter pohnpeiensis]